MGNKIIWKKKNKTHKKKTATTHSLCKCLAPRPLSSRKFDDYPLYTLTVKSQVNNGFNIILKKIIYFYFSKHLFLLHMVTYVTKCYYLLSKPRMVGSNPIDTIRQRSLSNNMHIVIFKVVRQCGLLSIWTLYDEMKLYTGLFCLN